MDHNGMPTKAHVECSGCGEALDGFATLIIAHENCCEVMAMCTNPDRYPEMQTEEIS